MSENVTEGPEGKKKDIVQAIYGFFADTSFNPLTLLIINSLAQGARDGIYHLQVQSAFSKAGNNFCDPILWRAYIDFNKELNLLTVLALAALYMLNYRLWFQSFGPDSSTGLSARKTYGKLLLMTLAYYGILAVIHIFTVGNYLKSALPKCSLPLSEKDMEAAMSAGFDSLMWLTVSVSVLYVIVANLYMRRQFPRPNPWKKDDKIQA